jgi:hemerythrin
VLPRGLIAGVAAGVCVANIEWTEELSVHHLVLDEQHKHIVALINALAAAAEGDGTTTADVILEHLARFLHFHFATEEQILRRAGYEGLPAHIQEHRRFAEQLNEEMATVRDWTPDYIRRLAIFMWTYAHRHMIGSDLAYAGCLARVRSG